MKFIDLFAGLGGFHVGLSRLGHKCVFACEIDQKLANLYKENFGLEVAGDIRKISITNIPKHDILCAGFPCQSFSQAGSQLGLKDNRGSLFYEITRILKYHKPRFFILENVPNLFRHNQGKTWKTIEKILTKERGYNIDKSFLSPHDFGIPQYRKRLFIVGAKNDLRHFVWPKPTHKGKKIEINSILDKNPKDAKQIPEREWACINLWQKFISAIPESEELPSFPIWAMEFGATYPYSGKPPIQRGKKELGKYSGSYGIKLKGLSKEDQLKNIPKYARGKNTFSHWKQDFIRQNREFYLKFKKQIDPLLPKIRQLPFSWQKFEWNCNGEHRTLQETILQFRASGIRAKRQNFSPSLIASTATQIPIITWEKRYMTKKEAARLQSLENLVLLPSLTSSFKALGNAVNADLVYLIGKNLIK